MLSDKLFTCRSKIAGFITAFLVVSFGIVQAQYQPLVPPELRGNDQFKLQGIHDANNIRTLFWNYGMVGDYPPDPIHVDLSVFHSVEVPKGSNENYSDGITPFVLAKIVQNNGQVAYIMETGYRERQGQSPIFNRIMRFEPRPGYFQDDPTINVGLSPAMSNDPRTWPGQWIDKLDDPDDPGWPGSWNGYFGKAIVADQESYVVYDDQYYDAWDYFPDNRDEGLPDTLRRRGLGLRVEQRGLQWANPQAGNVIYWVYDITNESTTDYIDNIIFGLYMDSGVGGSGIGVDGIPESDDDNAFWDKEAGLNLVYTWDKNGHGVKGTTGYLGYSYMETPGNPFDGIDNDNNGVVDERRDGGPGQLIEGQDAIRNYVESHYDLAEFEAFFGPLENRPAYRAGVWWTGDEDMDWVAEFHDTGVDGIFDTHDTGEKDGVPTNGEPNFDKTDVDESDQIGLTGFKMNRIRAGQGVPDPQIDDILFFTNDKHWPERLWNFFTSDSSFDNALVENYNIGFLFASGPFELPAGKTERFSLALGFGKDLRELKNTTRVVQQIYKSNYQFAVPPPQPVVKAFAGDGFVTLSWDDRAERAFDPVTNSNDFEGYRIYRSTDPTFLDPKVITTGTGSGPLGNGRPIAQFDKVDGVAGFSVTTVEGVAYFLGDETGITHTYTDSTVTNGQLYYYAVTAYDKGSDSLEIYPSENPITVSRTLRGGTILPPNVVEVRPNPPALGFTAAEVSRAAHVNGRGFGTIDLRVLNSRLVPNDHTLKVEFFSPRDSIHATHYGLFDMTSGDTLYLTGRHFHGEGRGPVGDGILVDVWTPETVTIDTNASGFVDGSSTDGELQIEYATTLPINLRRPFFPDNLRIEFSDVVVDTSIRLFGPPVPDPTRPAKFRVFAVTDSGDVRLKFRFFDINNDTTLSDPDEEIEVLTEQSPDTNLIAPVWNISIKGDPPSSLFGSGDVYEVKLIYPFENGDAFTFQTFGQTYDPRKARSSKEKPYVVPNPYVAAASFEPQRFAVSGRGERRIEFRALPPNCTIRIFTINGELVQTLHHSGNITKGYVAWDLRTKDNLEIAPGLYIFHVASKDRDPYIGKFAVIK